MASVFTVTGRDPIWTGGATRYTGFPGHDDQPTADATEANAQNRLRTAGVFSQLYVLVITNGTTGSSIIRTRKNAGNGAISVSIGIAATGVFQDTSNTDTVAAGDDYGFQAVVGGAGGSNLSDTSISLVFTATTDTSVRLGVGSNGAGTSSASTSIVAAIHGDPFGLTEATHLVTARAAGSLKNLAIFISANARSTTSTFRNRKNGANGALSVAIGASGTGWFEDTSNTETVASGDTLNFSLLTGTGTGSITSRAFGSDWASTNSTWLLAFWTSTGVSATNTRYFPPNGGGTARTTEAQAEILTRVALTANNLGVRVTTNTVSAASTATLRKNAADTAVTASITASTTGYYEDTTNSASYASTDTMAFAMVAGATGTSIISKFLIHCAAPAASAPAFRETVIMFN